MLTNHIFVLYAYYMQNNNEDKLSRIRTAAAALIREDIGYGTNPKSPPYLFSTENLVDTFHVIPVKDKTVLTIAASGDHVFDAYLNGAKHVKAFDFNLMQECVMHMKADLIHQMTYSQFMSFFFDTLMCGKTFESYKIIAPFMSHLSLEARAMLDEFYSCSNQAHFFNAHPFYRTEEQMYKTDKISYIQSENNFRQLQKRLPETIDFTLAHSKTIAAQDNQNYDVIHLSNIMTSYLYSRGDSIDSCETFFKETLKPLMNKLNPKGTLIICYLWLSDFCNKINYPYNMALSQAIRSQPNTLFLQAEFESVRHDPYSHIYDSILLAQKTK